MRAALRFTLRLNRPHGNLIHASTTRAAFSRCSREGLCERRRQSGLANFVPRFGLAVERLREQVRERSFACWPGHEYAGVLWRRGCDHRASMANWAGLQSQRLTHRWPFGPAVT